MRLMGIEAVYPKPRTSRPHPQHNVYPYLLRGLTINRPNQVWATDITYIPMARGFIYLAAVLVLAPLSGGTGEPGAKPVRVDVTELDVGETVTVAQLAAPEGVEVETIKIKSNVLDTLGRLADQVGGGS